MRVEVIRSRRRRKTVQASESDGLVRIFIPATMTRAEEQRWVGEMTARLRRRRVTAEIELEPRAAALAARYHLPRAAQVRWVDNQHSRWASCTPTDGVIRVSSRLGGFPPWVLDYVLVHELAHLAEPRHGPAFWALVNRYRRTERARGFLLAKSMEAAGPTGGGEAAGPTGGGEAAGPTGGGEAAGTTGTSPGGCEGGR